jgi:hypothetical protein
MTKKEEELLTDESTPADVLEKMVAEYPKFPHDVDEEIVHLLSYHPKSSAIILDKIFAAAAGDVDGNDYGCLNSELASHPNTSIETLEALQYVDDYFVVKEAKKQLKKRVKVKKNPLVGKSVYVVLYSHSDGCDSFVYADEKSADGKASYLERTVDEEESVWVEAQEIS